jgi:hypothetical protein
VEWRRGLVKSPQRGSLTKEVHLGTRRLLVAHRDGWGAYTNKLRKNLRCSVSRRTVWSDKNDGISGPRREALLGSPVLDICSAHELLRALQQLGSFESPTRLARPSSNVSHYMLDRQLVCIGTI